MNLFTNLYNSTQIYISISLDKYNQFGSCVEYFESNFVAKISYFNIHNFVNKYQLEQTNMYLLVQTLM